MMGKCTFVFLMMNLSFGFVPKAEAATSVYPGIRYISPYSESLGGVTLPLSEEIGNSLFNNPAALARNTKFKSEFLNLTLDANSVVLGSLGLSTLKITGLGGMSSTLNSNPNQLYSAGFGNLTALSWGGFAVGLLFQQRVRAYSDGTTANYETTQDFVPTLGYGLALARGVVRLGYSFQYVNKTTGTSTSPSDSSASFMNGMAEGHGFSHNASVNFVFPFAYLPTFSLLGRNIAGLHYSGGSLLPRAQNSSGLPADEKMSVDAAFNFTVRLSGSLKSVWYIQYKDLSSAANLPFLERFNLGVDLAMSQSVGLRAGFTGSQFSAGLGYRSPSSEINLAWYHERSPFANIAYWDTRYALQYKVFFREENTRDRDSEMKGK